jgi:hypothetical protein
VNDSRLKITTHPGWNGNWQFGFNEAEIQLGISPRKMADLKKIHVELVLI